MPTTERGRAAPQTRAERFAEYIRPAVVAAGYDIDSPRGGGKKALADDAGLSQSSVGRMLAGQTLPDPMVLERLAKVLHMPLQDLLYASGVITGMPASPPREARRDVALTPEEAARLLGITSSDRVQMFAAMARTLIEQERSDSGVGARKGA
jgi:transcriptional regulator with XRE-family HTH domain